MGVRRRLEIGPNLTSTAFDAGSIDHVYRKFRDELCRHIRRSFGEGPPEPEDIVQQTFVRFAAVEDRSTIDNPRAFLHRTAHNLAIDARRVGARTTKREAESDIFDVHGIASSAEDVLAARQEIGRVEMALAQLSDRQKSALLMHRIDGNSFADIARALRVSPSGARKLVHTAMTRLMMILDDE